jgi:hypothetical protein
MTLNANLFITIGNDEICIQGHFHEATNFKMAANKIVKLSMVSDFNENWYLGYFEVRNWLVMMKFASIFIEIGDRWQFDDFVGSHFEIGGLVKMTLNANCIITNQFLPSKYS